MDIAAIAKEAPYITALIIIVVIFTRAITDMQRANSASQDARDTSWREFLTEQRTQTTAAMGRLSAEITAVNQTLLNVHAEQIRHDAANTAASEEIRRELARTKRTTQPAATRAGKGSSS
jgi:hypothetical protein